MKFLGIVLGFLFAIPVFSSASPASDLTALLQKDQSIDIGVSVVNAKTKQALFQYNAHQLFTPASNAKLFTAYAALVYLKKDYTYQTTLWMDNTPKVPRDHRNFYLQFTGDPSLSDLDLRALLTAFQELGIHHLYGNIILVGNRFQLPEIAPGVVAEDLFWHYGAPIDAIIINENQIPIRVLPNKYLNQPVQIALVNPPVGVSLLSTRVNTVDFQTSMTDCSLLIHQNHDNQITLGGCWPIHQPTLLSLAIHNPEYFAASWVREVLARMNISVTGKILVGSLPNPKTLMVVAVHHSDPLSSLLTTMLQDSDDVYANAILKTVGAQYYGIGSYQMGVKAMAHILMPIVPFNFRSINIVDGAGLSRYDLISPVELTSLLVGIYQGPEATAFMKMLAGPGREGTLQYQFPHLKGRLFAKTGTLEHASTLSGFLITQHHTVLAFSIMMNHVLPSPHRVKPLLAKILRYLEVHY